MNFVTHHDARIPTTGTCLQGRIEINYWDIVKALGQPINKDGGKVDWEWNLRFSDGLVATVYNYKSGPNYGYHRMRGDIAIWHIGGNRLEVVDRIKNILTA
jgi:hypothetical protein